MPHPTHETLGCWMNGRRCLLAHTDIIIPTICLLMIHSKSCGASHFFWPGLSFSSSLHQLFFFSSFKSLSICVFLFRASLIMEFHLLHILLFSYPNTLDAFRGTISWNLNTWKQTIKDVAPHHMHHILNNSEINLNSFIP